MHFPLILIINHSQQQRKKMFRRQREERSAAAYSYPALRLIDDGETAKRVKDLFEELLEEGEGRGSSPDALPLKKMEIEADHPGCKCSKIDCLKLYCECFAKGRSCNANCICTGCQNHPGNEAEVFHAQQVANYRNPGHFKGVPAFVPARRCTCKKSSCRKNYCQCFRAGVKCGAQCECTDCHNGNPCGHYRHDWMEIESPVEIASLA